MEDLITVIVPVYNTSKYLKKCLDSIISQTYKKIEVILINDGSTDDSGKICDEFAKKDSRIRVIHKLNEGQSIARNLGITEASGKYISFIDSDDYVTNDFIEFLYNNMKEFRCDISCCGFSMVYPNNKIVNKNKQMFKGLLNNKEALKNLVITGYISDSPCNKLFKKELFEKIKFPINKVYEDRRILPVIFKNSNLIYCNPKVKYFYMQHNNSTTHNNSKMYQLIEATSERKEYIDSNYPDLKKYTTQDLLISYLSVSNSLIIEKKISEYNKLHNEMKKIICFNKYTYKKLKFVKKIQLYIYIKLPLLYKNIILLTKSRRRCN